MISPSPTLDQAPPDTISQAPADAEMLLRRWVHLANKMAGFAVMLLPPPKAQEYSRLIDETMRHLKSD